MAGKINTILKICCDKKTKILVSEEVYDLNILFTIFMSENNFFGEEFILSQHIVNEDFLAKCSPQNREEIFNKLVYWLKKTGFMDVTASAININFL